MQGKYFRKGDLDQMSQIGIPYAQDVELSNLRCKTPDGHWMAAKSYLSICLFGMQLQFGYFQPMLFYYTNRNLKTVDIPIAIFLPHQRFLKISTST